MMLSNKAWMCMCHWSALAGVIVPGANVVGPLWVWLAKRDKSDSIDVEGLESLNFQVSMTVLFVFAFFIRKLLFGKGLMMVLVVIDVLFIIVATYKVYKEGRYRYPFNLRLVK
ncbi:MAG: DUF4870 domain-containing protein [Breznakibacter sp.]